MPRVRSPCFVGDAARPEKHNTLSADCREQGHRDNLAEQFVPKFGSNQIILALILELKDRGRDLKLGIRSDSDIILPARFSHRHGSEDVFHVRKLCEVLAKAERLGIEGVVRCGFACVKVRLIGFFLFHHRSFRLWVSCCRLRLGDACGCRDDLSQLFSGAVENMLGDAPRVLARQVVSPSDDVRDDVAEATPVVEGLRGGRFRRKFAVANFRTVSYEPAAARAPGWRRSHVAASLSPQERR